MPIDLATRLFDRIQQKRNRLPVRNRIRIDASIQTIHWGKKRAIKKEFYSLLQKTVYKQMKNAIKVDYWGERKALKKYIEAPVVEYFARRYYFFIEKKLG